MMGVWMRNGVISGIVVERDVMRRRVVKMLGGLSW